MEINKIAKEIHKLAIEKGWWKEERPIPELLCLIHGEVSEALEVYRRNGLKADLADELADIVIRVFDMAEGLGIDIETTIYLKHSKNKKRPYRHGGKKC